MPEETGDQPESSWLLEPPGRGEVHVEVGLGSDTELSPEARSALERLLGSLEESEQAEVAGFACVSGRAPTTGSARASGGACPGRRGPAWRGSTAASGSWSEGVPLQRLGRA